MVIMNKNKFHHLLVFRRILAAVSSALICFHVGCIAISILPGTELSVPPQEGQERKRAIQLNLVAGENEAAGVNVGGYNEGAGAIVSLGVYNQVLYSGLNAGLANQSVFSLLSIGLVNESALGWLQLGLLSNHGMSFLNIAPINSGGGVQIGIINAGTSALQLGVINFCDDLVLRVFAYCWD